MSESQATTPQDELLKSRTQLRALEAELNRLKYEQHHHIASFPCSFEEGRTKFLRLHLTQLEVI